MSDNNGSKSSDLAALESYLASATRRRDWHAVSDAANDIRVLEAQGARFRVDLGEKVDHANNANTMGQYEDAVAAGNSGADIARECGDDASKWARAFWRTFIFERDAGNARIREIEHGIAELLNAADVKLASECKVHSLIERIGILIARDKLRGDEVGRLAFELGTAKGERDQVRKERDKYRDQPWERMKELGFVVAQLDSSGSTIVQSPDALSIESWRSWARDQLAEKCAKYDDRSLRSSIVQLINVLHHRIADATKAAREERERADKAESLGGQAGHECVRLGGVLNEMRAAVAAVAAIDFERPSAPAPAMSAYTMADVGDMIRRRNDRCDALTAFECELGKGHAGSQRKA